MNILNSRPENNIQRNIIPAIDSKIMTDVLMFEPSSSKPQ
jgi:hypothetical protein